MLIVVSWLDNDGYVSVYVFDGVNYVCSHYDMKVLVFFSMFFVFFFFKQKAAYEMRISDWSSDVCSSDLAAEFEARTPYMYSTYEAPTFGEPENEAQPSDRKKVVILGGGPNRIGQGIEFDYCCCHACFALEEAGYETIMINCNPATVRSEEQTSELMQLMRNSYAVFCLTKTNTPY